VVILILAGIVYAIWADSLTVAVLTASLVVYRAYRPSTFWQRLREVRYLKQAATDDGD
jgi:hypothetical protein